MTIKIVDIGTIPNDGTGDPLRAGIDKLNKNDEFLVSAEGGGFVINNAGIVTAVSDNDFLGFMQFSNKLLKRISFGDFFKMMADIPCECTLSNADKQALTRYFDSRYQRKVSLKARSSVNHVPVATAKNLDATKNTTTTYSQADLLAGCTDVDNDTLSVVSVLNAVHCSINLHTDGSVDFTPEADYVGDAGFDYVISDGYLNSDAATITINVIESALILTLDAPTEKVLVQDYLGWAANGIQVDCSINCNVIITTNSGTISNGGDYSGTPAEVNALIDAAIITGSNVPIEVTITASAEGAETVTKSFILTTMADWGTYPDNISVVISPPAAAEVSGLSYDSAPWSVAVNEIAMFLPLQLTIEVGNGTAYGQATTETVLFGWQLMWQDADMTIPANNTIPIIWDGDWNNDTISMQIDWGYSSSSASQNLTQVISSIPTLAINKPADLEIDGLQSDISGWSVECNTDEIIDIAMYEISGGLLRIQDVVTGNSISFSGTLAEINANLAILTVSWANDWNAGAITLVCRTATISQIQATQDLTQLVNNDYLTLNTPTSPAIIASYFDSNWLTGVNVDSNQTEIALTIAVNQDYTLAEMGGSMPLTNTSTDPLIFIYTGTPEQLNFVLGNLAVQAVGETTSPINLTFVADAPTLQETATLDLYELADAPETLYPIVPGMHVQIASPGDLSDVVGVLSPLPGFTLSSAQSTVYPFVRVAVYSNWAELYVDNVNKTSYTILTGSIESLNMQLNTLQVDLGQPGAGDQITANILQSQYAAYVRDQPNPVYAGITSILVPYLSIAVPPSPIVVTNYQNYQLEFVAINSNLAEVELHIDLNSAYKLVNINPLSLINMGTDGNWILIGSPEDITANIFELKTRARNLEVQPPVVINFSASGSGLSDAKAINLFKQADLPGNTTNVVVIFNSPLADITTTGGNVQVPNFVVYADDGGSAFDPTVEFITLTITASGNGYLQINNDNAPTVSIFGSVNSINAQIAGLTLDTGFPFSGQTVTAVATGNFANSGVAATQNIVLVTPNELLVGDVLTLEQKFGLITVSMLDLLANDTLVNAQNAVSMFTLGRIPPAQTPLQDVTSIGTTYDTQSGTVTAYLQPGSNHIPGTPDFTGAGFYYHLRSNGIPFLNEAWVAVNITPMNETFDIISATGGIRHAKINLEAWQDYITLGSGSPSGYALFSWEFSDTAGMYAYPDRVILQSTLLGGNTVNLNGCSQLNPAIARIIYLKPTEVNYPVTVVLTARTLTRTFTHTFSIVSSSGKPVDYDPITNDVAEISIVSEIGLI